MSNMSVQDKIMHYQRSIDKSKDNLERLAHCISRLCDLPVTVKHLQTTGIGRTVNGLRKYSGNVGQLAKILVGKWKKMVVDAGNSDDEEEDEACVPDAPELYKDSDEYEQNDEVYSSSIIQERDTLKTVQSERNVESCKISSREGDKTSMKMAHDHDKDAINFKKSSSYKSEAERDKLREESHDDKKSKEGKVDGEKKREESNSKHKSSKDKPCKSTDFKKYSKDKENDHKKRKLEISIEDVERHKKKKISEKSQDNMQSIMNVDNEEKLSADEVSDHDKCTQSQITHNTSPSKDKRKEEKDKSRDGSGKQKGKEINSKARHSEEKNDKKSRESHHSSKESKSKDHNSSSSNKDHVMRKERKDEESKKSCKKEKINKHSKDLKLKNKMEMDGDDGIDCNSGTSFAEALGMCTKPISSRKRNSMVNQSPIKTSKTENVAPSSSSSEKSYDSIKQHSSVSGSSQPLSLLLPSASLEPLNVDLTSTLPEISPNYKPLPSVIPNPHHRRQEEDRMLSEVIYVKNQRTKVYSGNKTGYTSVPTLFELCIRVLIENIDALEYTGGVPYYIIKPVLERANADQLFALEHHNHYLLEETDSLWKYHCNKEFRNKQKEEMETWREMYMRCLEEREAKLKMLTANIKQNAIDKSQPVRVAKLAYVDNVAKPPRNVLRKQAKYGTAKNLPNASSDLKKKLIAGAGNAATNISVPTPPLSRVKTNATAPKKTKAPLMQKALQLIKGRYKR